MKRASFIEQKLVEKYLEKLKSIDTKNKSNIRNQKYKFEIIQQLTNLLFKFKYFNEMYKSISSLIYLFLNTYNNSYPIDIFSISKDKKNIEKKKYKEILISEIYEDEAKKP